MGDAFGQQCLLLAWAHIEAAACEEGAAGNLCWERNEITHAMEKAGFSFEQFSRKPDHFPCFCQECLGLIWNEMSPHPSNKIETHWLFYSYGLNSYSYDYDYDHYYLSSYSDDHDHDIDYYCYG